LVGETGLSIWCIQVKDFLLSLGGAMLKTLVMEEGSNRGLSLWQSLLYRFKSL